MLSRRLMMCVGALALTGVVAVSITSAFAQQTPDRGTICDGAGACRDLTTKLPVRVLPRADRKLYAEMSDVAAPLKNVLPAFVPLFVFEWHGVSYADAANPRGWLRVGYTPDRPDGYIRAADAHVWRLPIVAAFAERGKDATARTRAVVFDNPHALFNLMQDPKSADMARGLSARVESGELPSGLMAREPQVFHDIKSKFFILPVLDYVDLHTPAPLASGRLLQIAGLVAGAESIQRRPDDGAAEPCRRTVDCSAFENVPPPLELLSRPANPPPDVTGWLIDRDMADLQRRSIDLYALVTRADLDQLTKSLQELIEAYEIDKLTGDPFFRLPRLDDDPFIIRPPGMDSFMVRPPGRQWLDPPDERRKIPVLPAWVLALPFESRFRNLTLDGFVRLPDHARGDLQQRGRALIARYRSILERQEAWIRLSDRMKHEDYVYPLPFTLLP